MWWILYQSFFLKLPETWIKEAVMNHKIAGAPNILTGSRRFVAYLHRFLNPSSSSSYINWTKSWSVVLSIRCSLSRASHFIEFLNYLFLHIKQRSVALKPKGFSKMVLQKSSIIFQLIEYYASHFLNLVSYLW